MISRRGFLNRAAAAGAAALMGRNAAASAAGIVPESETLLPVVTPRAGSPNVLIFMPDQQNGATVLPGSPVMKPAMDKFLQSAVAFTQAHCPAPHCCPSRASFMSSLYPSEHGVYNNVDTDTAIHRNPFPDTPFWGNWLKEAGYNLGYSGKLHVGHNITPENCGFEDFYDRKQDNGEGGGGKQAQLMKRARSENKLADQRKPGEYLRPDWSNGHLYRTLPGDSAFYESMSDTKIMRAGIAGMKRLASTDVPWCVMISNSGAHDPYDAPKNFVDQYNLTDVTLPASFSDLLKDKPRVYQRQRFQYWSQLSNDETRDALRHYYAKCSYQDSLFADMLAALDSTGQAHNTIVIYVSDHGDYMASHGLWMKGVPSFKEAYHIPAVIRWPKGIKHQGSQVDAFVDQVDFGATILEACGVATKKPISGRSLLPWLRGETPTDWRQHFHSQMNGVELYYTQRITMSKEWKYVYNGFDYDELYDLRNDPHEMKNLAFPDLVEKEKLVEGGGGFPRDKTVPWPQLPSEMESERKVLLASMWDFATEHHDIIFNPYGTVALAPYGPALSQKATDAPPAQP